jgi:tetratricopeptide (TPR) repeat protein
VPAAIYSKSNSKSLLHPNFSNVAYKQDSDNSDATALPSLTAMRRMFSRQKPQTKSPDDVSLNLNDIKLILWEGIKLEEQSDWSEAAKRFEICTKSYEKLGSNDLLMPQSHSHLANAYSHMGRLAEAESHWRTSEAVCMKNFGRLHTYTLDAASNVFLVLWRQRKAEEANTKGKSVLAALEKTEGAESFRTLKTVLVLGEICVYFGQYETAILHHRRAFAGLESTIGIGSTETINAQFLLGAVYGELGNFIEAATIYKQNQEVCEKTRGVASEVYLRATLNLGRTQRRVGNDVEAEKTLRSMLPASKANTAHQHWEQFFAKAVKELITIYKNSGRNDDAQNIEKWANGAADALLVVEGPNSQHQETLGWSPRAGNDDQVCSSSVGHQEQAIILIIIGVRLGYQNPKHHGRFPPCHCSVGYSMPKRQLDFTTPREAAG